MLSKAIAETAKERYSVEGTMLEVYTGKRGSAVTVADPAAAAARFQTDLMAGGTGWFQVCHPDGAITLVPIGMAPLTFETEGNVDLKSVRSSYENQDKLDAGSLRRSREGGAETDSAPLEDSCWENYWRRS